MSEKKTKSQLVKEWRETNWGELDVTLTVLKGIRDNEKGAAKERIEAGKAIARMLGMMGTERIETKTGGGSPAPDKAPEQRAGKQSEIDTYLDQLEARNN